MKKELVTSDRLQDSPSNFLSTSFDNKGELDVRSRVTGARFHKCLDLLNIKPGYDGYPTRTSAKRSLCSPSLSLGGRLLSLMAGSRSSSMADEYCTR